MRPTTQRVPRGFTRDPWPCCNTAANPVVGRRKEGICDHCRGLIETGEEARRQRAGAGHRTYVWPKFQHHWPRYYGEYQFGTPDTREELGDAMFHLVAQLTNEAHTRGRTHGLEPVLECEDTHTRYQGPVAVTTNPNTRERLNTLDKAIRKALTAAYAEGRSRGRNAMMQLAHGELSMQDFYKDGKP